MAVLTKDAILNVKNLELKELEVDEWGGSVFMGHMTLAERFEYDEKFTSEINGEVSIKEPSNPAYMLEYIRMVLKDASGNYLFSEEDVKLLLNKQAKVIVKVFKACTEYNSMKYEVDDIKKKLETAPKDYSSTD